jgi:SAM-dependent methyltransferase
MNKEIDKIETQYNEFPYPLPIDDMHEKINQGYSQASDPKLIWQKLFPEKKYKDDLNVLIAGCGTNQAIYHALKFPNSSHYAIDVSENSLKHVNNMIKKYDIKNLKAEKKDLIELKNNNEFDYVISTGVIHHTKNPQESLNKLVESTNSDGALFIMVYATYLRVGIYYLQDAFRYLGLKSDEKSMNIGKQLIKLSPKDHYSKNYIKSVTKNTTGSKDLTFDAGLIDTFFNQRDKSYNAFELKKLISETGSYFQNWYSNQHHYRQLFNFGNLNELEKNLNKLDPWELTDFTQKINTSLGKFTFVLRKQKKYQNRFFKIKELQNYTYVRKLFKDHNENNINDYSKKAIIIDIDQKVELDILEKIIWNQLEGKIEDILLKTNELISNLDILKKISLNELKEIIHKFWKNGYVSLADI